jgi:hypothetical protein
VTMGLMVWALRPNIDRLIHGTERVVGLRAKWKKKTVSEGGAENPSAADEQK